MRRLLTGSKLVRDRMDGTQEFTDHGLIQDRYSTRCYPQYIGQSDFAQLA